MKPKRASEPQLLPRMRIVCGEEIALGPGKIDLLASIAETGSIRKAAEQQNMSYMRAWTLVRTMNQCFEEPLVESARGGNVRGGAHLTEAGSKVLGLYQRMERDCLAATGQDWQALKKLLRK